MIDLAFVGVILYWTDMGVEIIRVRIYAAVNHQYSDDMCDFNHLTQGLDHATMLVTPQIIGQR